MAKYLSSTLLLCCLVLESWTFADWNPVVINGIKWTAPNQGIQTIQYTESVGILRLPVKYYGGVDANADGVIDDADIEKFHEWVERHIPRGYTGPIGMDYEKPFWDDLRAETLSPQRLNEIMAVYVQGLKIAKSVRPEASWGYYGLPTRRNTTAGWLDQGLSLEPVIANSAVLFPSIYNCNRGKDRTKDVKRQVSVVLKEAAGRMPVYAFVTPRYCGEGGDRSLFVPDDLFLKQANAAMQAVWIDKFGVQHRIKGLVLWDAYGYTPESEWGQLDETHRHDFEMLQALVEAWAKAMVGKDVIDAPAMYDAGEQGLPEPINTAETLEDTSGSSIGGNRPRSNFGNNNRERVNEESGNRLPSGRID